MRFINEFNCFRPAMSALDRRIVETVSLTTVAMNHDFLLWKKAGCVLNFNCVNLDDSGNSRKFDHNYILFI